MENIDSVMPWAHGWSLYLAIDPGLKNCAAALVAIHNTSKVCTMLWNETADLTGPPQPSKDASQKFFERVLCTLSAYTDVKGVIVEYQPPLQKGGVALLRHNTWIEGFAIAYFMSRGYNVVHAHPSAVKQHFQIRSGVYKTNKLLAVVTAKSLISNPDDIKKDHEADCVLCAIFVHRKGLLK